MIVVLVPFATPQSSAIEWPETCNVDVGFAETIVRNTVESRNLYSNDWMGTSNLTEALKMPEKLADLGGALVRDSSGYFEGMNSAIPYLEKCVGSDYVQKLNLPQFNEIVLAALETQGKTPETVPEFGSVVLTIMIVSIIGSIVIYKRLYNQSRFSSSS